LIIDPAQQGFLYFLAWTAMYVLVALHYNHGEPTTGLGLQITGNRRDVIERPGL
jgi:hypothetical protein